MSKKKTAGNGHFNKLTPRQSKFIQNLGRGLGKADSARLAGYSPSGSSSIASQLLKKTKIVKALEQAGLTDNVIAKGIKTNVEAGMGVKATASDSLRGLELATKLKGYQDTKPDKPTTQTNILVQELNMLSDKDLNAKLEAIQKEIEALKK